jgi:hypothetical protein
VNSGVSEYQCKNWCHEEKQDARMKGKDRQQEYTSRYCSVWSRYYATTARKANIPDPFLGNSSVNKFPLLGSSFLIMQQLDYNNATAVFSMWSVLRSLELMSSLKVQFCTGVCEERTSAGGRGITIVGAVTRKRLVTDTEH